MKHLEFVPPNFRCRVADWDGNLYAMYVHADSEADLRDKVGSALFELIAFEPYDFSEWKMRAKRETQKARCGYHRKGFKFNNLLWAELKQYLFILSMETCGYCEANVRITNPGDVEHYRPKRRVEEEPTHPGYFWLAYDESNYVPCCSNCNSHRGKRSHFPLADGCQRAIKAEEIAEEQPLLLNPFHEEDPARHFRFIGPDEGAKFGRLEGITPAGSKSEKIYHLNRPNLVKARRDAFQDLSIELQLALLDPVHRQKVIEEASAGRRPFSLMVRQVVEGWVINRKRLTQEEYEATMRGLDNDLQMLQSSALTAARFNQGTKVRQPYS